MKKYIYFLGFIMLCLNACRVGDTSDALSLSGEWRFALDPTDKGIEEAWYNNRLGSSIQLPGSLQEQGFGNDVDIRTEWTGQVVDSSWYTSPVYEKYRKSGNVKVPFWLNPDKHYTGAAWYQKDINIPTAWEGRPVLLELERTHWETMLYVDGQQMGQQDALLTPHRYLLKGLSAGQHTLTLRVDNRINIPVGINAHSVSDHTQSNWNGIIGNIRLSAKPSIYIENVQLYPDINNKKVLAKINLKGEASQRKSAISLQAYTLNGKPVGTSSTLDIDGKQSDIPLEISVDLGEQAELWSEHTPNVYQMKVALSTAEGNDEQMIDFGLREFKANGTQFEINGTPVFLRGTLECCIFPLTGYPAMDYAYWEKIYTACQSYGLNHVRFHSWCPPKAAFHVADSMGVYLQVECGGWATVGDGGSQDEWFYKEGDRILAEYGNHPSFCMMAYGNEPGGANQVKYLSDLVGYWKKKDSRRVYTSSGGWPYISNADYWNAPDPRIQGWGAGLSSRINAQSPSTDYDFREIIRKEMPTVSHEIGQWCVYPDLKEIEKYTGVLKAKNFEIFKETLEQKQMSDLTEHFLYASGRLQTLCYKADIEAALRTPGFAGFQLLDLHDFPGQGTALVGVLNPFWESKGYVSGPEYSQFCESTVPLVRFPKMVWSNNETMDVPLEIAHYGNKPLEGANIVWTLSTPDEQVLASGHFTADLPIGRLTSIGTISCPLQTIEKASQLEMSVQIENTPVRNAWNVWVYPSQKQTIKKMPFVTFRLDAMALDKLNKGENVLLCNSRVRQEKGGDIQVGFSSIFWNTAWTRKQAPHTLGIYCDPKHPALASFPNEGYSDYQWWDIVSNCHAMVLDDFPADFRPVVHLIDDWFTNRKLGILFEAKIGKGNLLVCSIDLQKDPVKYPAIQQFKQSILEYISSDSFKPTKEIDPELVRQLF